MKFRVVTMLASIAIAATAVSGCGQQIAGTSATAVPSSGARSAGAPTAGPGTRPSGPETVTATPQVTQTIVMTPPATVTAAPPQPQTVTQTPPPVVVVPGPRVTVTQAPATVYYPDSGSAADTQVASDWPRAESMVGWWIPQLSSNIDSASAMAKFRPLSGRYNGVFMVASADFTSFRNAGYYVTMISVPFTSAPAANAWCDSQGFPADDCLAKQLSHTDGPDGMTVERG